MAKKKKKNLKFDKVQKSRSGGFTVAMVVLLSHWWSYCRSGGPIVGLVFLLWSFCRNGGPIVALVVLLSQWWSCYRRPIWRIVVLLSQWWSYCRIGVCIVVLLSQWWSYCRNGGSIVAEWWSYCRRCICRMVVLLSQWWSYCRKHTCRMVVELSLKAAAESLDSAAKTQKKWPLPKGRLRPFFFFGPFISYIGPKFFFFFFLEV